MLNNIKGGGVECLICGKDAFLKTTQQKGYKEFELYRIYHCAACNTSFSLPRINTDSLYRLIYENGEKVPGYGRYWNYYNKVKSMDSPIDYLANAEPAYWSLVHSLKNILKIPKDAHILETGTGLGYMTYSLRKDGYMNAYGLDKANIFIPEHYPFRLSVNIKVDYENRPDKIYNFVCAVTTELILKFTLFIRLYVIRRFNLHFLCATDIFLYFCKNF